MPRAATKSTITKTNGAKVSRVSPIVQEKKRRVRRPASVLLESLIERRARLQTTMDRLEEKIAHYQEKLNAKYNPYIEKTPEEIEREYQDLRLRQSLLRKALKQQVQSKH